MAYTTHSKCKRQTSKLSVGFKSTNPAVEQLQTYTCRLHSHSDWHHFVLYTHVAVDVLELMYLFWWRIQWCAAIKVQNLFLQCNFLVPNASSYYNNSLY